MRRFLLVSGATFILAGCSQAPDNAMSSEMSGETVNAQAVTADSQPVADIADGTDPAIAQRDAIPANTPQLAYEYGLSYRLGSAEITKLMRSHASLCEQQGPNTCRIVGMDMSGDVEQDSIHGTLQLAVAANRARSVTAKLDEAASRSDAKQAGATITSEDVSKLIVDTQARIRAREELRDRLMEVLKTRKGSIKELVEAERSVAAVNEELDQAKSWLAETQGRVAYSKVSIDYAPATAATSDFTAPIANAVGSLGSILGGLVAVLIVLLAIGLPIGAIIAGVMWVRRRVRTVSVES